MSTRRTGLMTDMQSLWHGFSRRPKRIEGDLPCEVLWHSTANVKPALVTPIVHVYPNGLSLGIAHEANGKHTRVIPLMALSVEATGATSRIEANSI